MKLNKEILKEKNACRDGLAWYVENGCETVAETVEKLIAEKKLNWANWLITRMLGKEDCVRYAIFASREVLHIFEAKYPEDKRPRLAIEAAEHYLKNKNANAATAAATAAANAANDATAVYAAGYAANAVYAADAVYAAGYAANAATNAYDAAAYAANATVYAANAAGYAANAATNAYDAANAADDAANDALKIKIIRYGIEFAV